MGHKIKILTNEYQHAGEIKVIWDGTDQCGNKVSAGLYLYTINVNNVTQKGKLHLIRNK